MLFNLLCYRLLNYCMLVFCVCLLFVSPIQAIYSYMFLNQKAKVVIISEIAA